MGETGCLRRLAAFTLQCRQPHDDQGRVCLNQATCSTAVRPAIRARSPRLMNAKAPGQSRAATTYRFATLPLQLRRIESIPWAETVPARRLGPRPDEPQGKEFSSLRPAAEAGRVHAVALIMWTVNRISAATEAGGGLGYPIELRRRALGNSATLPSDVDRSGSLVSSCNGAANGVGYQRVSARQEFQRSAIRPATYPPCPVIRRPANPDSISMTDRGINESAHYKRAPSEIRPT